MVDDRGLAKQELVRTLITALFDAPTADFVLHQLSLYQFRQSVTITGFQRDRLTHTNVYEIEAEEVAEVEFEEEFDDGEMVEEELKLDFEEEIETESEDEDYYGIE